MPVEIIAVGQKMPRWCIEACEEYLKRLQRYGGCLLTEIPPANRHRSYCVQEVLSQEGEKIRQKIKPHAFVVALAISGKSWSSEKLSQQIRTWQQTGKIIQLLIGGPDGLSRQCLESANVLWSLSPLTLPHALARVLVLEQLYRGMSLLKNHPYHK